MKQIFFFLAVMGAGKCTFCQKLSSIHFNLYTDSLKKGFYNYINVDGRYPDGRWVPLDSGQISLSANTGFFRGNDLFIDSSYTGETVRVKAVLKADLQIRIDTTIYIRKRPFTEPLKTSDEILSEPKKKRKKKSL